MGCGYWKDHHCTLDGDDCVYHDHGAERSAMVADSLRSELAAILKRNEELETENARKDQALRYFLTYHLEGIGQLTHAIGGAEAALAPDTGERVLNKAELYLLQSTLQELMDVQNGCPLPKYEELFNAANEQARELIEWLGALIGEGE